MFAILKKEIATFFSSLTGLLVIGIFLLINGLLLWVFKDGFNILNAGFADLTHFFYLTPWVFLFLIPALTMRSFAEERSKGTLELLKTAPIHLYEITLGKFLGVLCLVCLALLPTLVYVYTVYQLGNPVGNIDLGSTLGSYLGILCIASTYASVGLFSSTLSSNQLVAFVVAVICCFFLFYGFDALATTLNTYSVSLWGIQEHYKSISKGVLDSRDLLYFASITFVFLVLTTQRLKHA